MGSVIKKVMFVGRTTATAMGLVVALALVLGVATTALAAVPGDPLRLGKVNSIGAISRLVGAVDGPMMVVDNNSSAANARALDLRVEPGKVPMRVDSSTKVVNLNADQLDGKSEADFYATGSKVADSAHADTATDAQNAGTVDGRSASEIGVNGLQYVSSTSAANSASSKLHSVSCPAGKWLVGTGFGIDYGSNGASYPNEEADVVVTSVNPGYTSVTVQAFEEEPTSNNWSVIARAVCATAP